MCRARTIPKSALTLIELLEFFGATIHGDLSAWLVTEFAGDDAKVSRVETLMEETEGGGGRFGIEARIYSSVELEDLNKAAEQRLGIRILRAID
ncbi:hypothetical protein B0H11DRAFT_596271 [Mycena galericulata]|nr:hypothetical protein B0H11DRAFT_596271 [Mycena galericulata]